ncbi:MAG: dihydroorotate dehydrogenase-like protein [Chloroflexi bacterium]|nr:dihydroorotate dehydrogenase-like protein [Chloroflexota bacterium]
MIDLTTTYMGLTLKNPLVPSASPLSKSLDTMKRLEDHGAAAIVLYSLFEEQIEHESKELNHYLTYGAESYAEAVSYFPDLGEYNLGPDQYLNHIRKAKAALQIPVIASLNGISKGGWTRYAKLMEEAGADGIELNVYHIPTDGFVSSGAVEQMYLDLVREVKATVQIPVAVKMMHFFSSIPYMAIQLDRAGANGLVMFNRFYQPDIDLENLEVVTNLTLSSSYELRLRLRWVAIMFGQLVADMAVTGGVHTAEDVVKAMMVGAKVTQLASVLLHNGVPRLSDILVDLQRWLETHEYESIAQMQGSMSQRHVANTAAFERANYMKVLQAFEVNME